MFGAVWSKRKYALVPSDNERDLEQVHAPRRGIKTSLVTVIFLCWTVLVSLLSFHAGQRLALAPSQDDIQREYHFTHLLFSELMGIQWNWNRRFSNTIARFR